MSSPRAWAIGGSRRTHLSFADGTTKSAQCVQVGEHLDHALEQMVVGRVPEVSQYDFLGEEVNEIAQATRLGRDHGQVVGVAVVELPVRAAHT